MTDQEQDPLTPSEQRGGSNTGDHEAEEKGQWAGQAKEGVVPAELGGSDAPDEMLADDPELGSTALGKTAQSEEPATEQGIDRRAGDRADATAQGGPETPRGEEPDLKDAPAGPRQPDLDSAA
jgi:hypothetical protein